MNKLKKILILSLFTSSISLSADVIQSGKWSDSSVWSDAIVPTSSKDVPFTNFTFGADNVIFGVDSNQWVDKLAVGSNTNTSINIDSGSTLYLNANTTTKEYITSSSASNVIKFGGEGTLHIGNANISDAVVSGDIIFDVNVKSSHWGNFLFVKNQQSKITINKLFDAVGQINLSNSTFILSNSATLNCGNLIGYGDMSFAEKSTATVRSLNASNLKLNGAMVVTGLYDYADSRMAIKLGGNNVLGENASLSSTSTNANAIVQLTGSFTSNAKQATVNFSGKTYLNKNFKLILNSSNAITTEGAATQGASNFNLINYWLSYNWDTKVRTENIEATQATIVLGANNDFGSFTFYNGTTFTLETNGFASKIEKFLEYSEGSSFLMKVTNHQDFTLLLMDLTNIGTYDDGNDLRATNILVSSGEIMEEYAYLIFDQETGGYWVNATNAIPEPAEVAFVLGVIALGVLGYRKRNVR